MGCRRKCLRADFILPNYSSSSSSSSSASHAYSSLHADASTPISSSSTPVHLPRASFLSLSNVRLGLRAPTRLAHAYHLKPASLLFESSTSTATPVSSMWKVTAFDSLKWHRFFHCETKTQPIRGPSSRAKCITLPVRQSRSFLRPRSRSPTPTGASRPRVSCIISRILGRSAILRVP